MPSFSRVCKWIFLENTSIRSQRQSQNASVHDFVTTREFYKLETRSGEDNNNNSERAMRSINKSYPPPVGVRVLTALIIYFLSKPKGNRKLV